jgi:hypothetical protein
MTRKLIAHCTMTSLTDGRTNSAFRCNARSFAPYDR